MPDEFVKEWVTVPLTGTGTATTISKGLMVDNSIRPNFGTLKPAGWVVAKSDGKTALVLVVTLKASMDELKTLPALSVVTSNPEQVAAVINKESFNKLNFDVKGN